MVIIGKIRQDCIKKTGQKIMEQYADKVSINFEENKAFLDKYTEISTIRLRNRLAGYLVTLKKNEGRTITSPRKEKKSGDRKKYIKKQNRKWV